MCGEPGTYRGQWGAVASHPRLAAAGRAELQFAGGWRHRHSEDQIRAAEARRQRYCEGCFGEVERHVAANVRGHWLCGTCAYVHRRRGDRDALSDLRRTRYLELECPTLERLRAFDKNLDAMALDLEELHARFSGDRMERRATASARS